MFSIGLMSGTSMDGIDAALLKTDGINQIEYIAHATISYDHRFKILLKAAEFAVHHTNGDLNKAKEQFTTLLRSYLKNLNIHDTAIEETLQNLVAYLDNGTNTIHKISFDDIVMHSTKLHADLVKKLLDISKKQSSEIDVIGYHGQTLFHKPSEKMTIQIGNGVYLAEITGITVVDQFRKHDVENGGQGAPLAPLYHQALSCRDHLIPVAVINCGGIANITVISGKNKDEVIGFDTGPGNGLIDRYLQKKSKGQMDTDGQYGKQGKVDDCVFQLLCEKAISIHNFTEKSPPKSLDINDLILISELDDLSLEDACRTLEAFTAELIVKSLDHVKEPYPKFFILAGGGWHNPVIKSELCMRLQKRLGDDLYIKTADEVSGWNSQSMEAEIFAYLAVRSLKDLPLSYPNTTGISCEISGGAIHMPTNGATTTVKDSISTRKDPLIVSRA